MKACMDETDRRRKIQILHNETTGSRRPPYQVSADDLRRSMGIVSEVETLTDPVIDESHETTWLKGPRNLEKTIQSKAKEMQKNMQVSWSLSALPRFVVKSHS